MFRSYMAVHLGIPVASPPLHIEDFPLGKVGGSPLWLLPDAPTVCEGCENSLDFILQVYCPLEGEATYHRYLYVFICSVCHEVHIYRAQLPQVNSLYPQSDEVDLSDEQLLDLIVPEGPKPDLALTIIEEDEDITQAARALYALDLNDRLAVEDFAEQIPYVQSTETRCSAEEGWEDTGPPGDIAFELLQLASTRQRKQCVRYCRFDVPLWYSVQSRPCLLPSPCPCGSARLFEFQVMPQSIHYSGLQCDFGSIYVYTCERSCSRSGYLREVALVQDSL